MSFIKPFFECVSVHLTVSGDNYFVASVYRLPKVNISQFFDELERIFDYIDGVKFNRVFFLGDWSLDLLKHNEDINVQRFINLMNSDSCISLTTKPTRVSETSATLIDHVWTSVAECNTGNYIVYTDITDHFPLISQFKLIKTNAKPPTSIRKGIITDAGALNFCRVRK